MVDRLRAEDEGRLPAAARYSGLTQADALFTLIRHQFADHVRRVTQIRYYLAAQSLRLSWRQVMVDVDGARQQSAGPLRLGVARRRGGLIRPVVGLIVTALLAVLPAVPV